MANNSIKKPSVPKAPKKVNQPKPIKVNRPSSSDIQQGYVKSPEPKQPEPKQPEPKQSESKQIEPKQSDKSDLKDFKDEYKNAKPTESSKPQGLVDKVGTKAFNKGLKAADTVAKAKYGESYDQGKKIVAKPMEKKLKKNGMSEESAKKFVQTGQVDSLKDAKAVSDTMGDVAMPGVGRLRRFRKKTKNLRRVGRAGVLGAKGYVGFQILKMLKLAMSFAKAAFSAISGAITGAISGIAGAISSFVTGAISAIGSFLGVATSVATTIFTGGVIGVTALAITVATTLFGGAFDPRVDSYPLQDCEEEVKELMGNVQPGDNQTQLENAKKIYSVFKTYGLNDNQIAGILGNWTIESGIDPTAIEGLVSVEKYTIGPKKMDAMKNHHAYTNKLLNSYRISVNRQQYTSTVDGTLYAGYGLPQVTAGDRIERPAKALGKNWWDMDFQMAFILAKGSELTTGKKGGKDFFNTYKKDCASSSPAECAAYFLTNYEGVPNDINKPKRLTSANEWIKKIKTFQVDEGYANMVIDSAKKLGAMASTQAVEDALDDCKSARKGIPIGGRAYSAAGTVPENLRVFRPHSTGADWGNGSPRGQCVWYVYNRARELGGYSLSSMGDGGRWGASARRGHCGTRIWTSYPRPGLALSTKEGYYGHIMFVEAVTSEGVWVSEYNYVSREVFSERFISHGMVHQKGGEYIWIGVQPNSFNRK